MSRLMKMGARFGALAVLAATASLLLAACGDDDKPTLVFSDLNWDSAQTQNWIARKIIEPGFGYETDAILGGTIPMLNALAQGETHISMEIWYSSQQEAFDKEQADGTVKVVGRTIDDNWQSGFAIPQYIADANPGLRSASDLANPEYMKIFETVDSGGKARAISCIPGWECEITNQLKLEAYGLEDAITLQSPGSGEALAAEIDGSFEKEEPILFYYWGPTVLAGQLDYLLLEEPAYTDECWAGDRGCAYPSDQILIVVNAEIEPDIPEVVEFLGNYNLTSADVEGALAWMEANNKEPIDAGQWWLENNEDIWTTWVSSDVADKVKDAL